MTEAEIIRQYLKADVYALAAKDKWFENYDKRWLIQQIQSRQKAELKLPTWYGNFNLLFPAPLSVEQSSSELTADYKTSVVSGQSLIDLTGGMGVDCSFFAQRFQQVTFIEMQEILAETARHNFQVLGIKNIRVLCGDSAQLLPQLPHADVVFIDPARRLNNRKVFRIEDCQPDLITIFPLIKTHCNQLLVKLSPMLDIPLLLKTLPCISDIHLVAVHNEIKELLVLCDFQQDTNPQIHCVNIEKDRGRRRADFPYDERNKPIYIAERPERYLYEPHATLLKSEMMNAEAQKYELKKLHPHSHLYTSDQLRPDFFGRIFEIDDTFSMQKSELRHALADITAADITIRNFPLSEAELRKKLKIGAGGSVTLFATTLNSGQHIILKTHKALH